MEVEYFAHRDAKRSETLEASPLLLVVVGCPLLFLLYKSGERARDGFKEGEVSRKKSRRRWNKSNFSRRQPARSSVVKSPIKLPRAFFFPHPLFASRFSSEERCCWTVGKRRGKRSDGEKRVGEREEVHAEIKGGGWAEDFLQT